jgi:hypothetical protein
MMNQPFTGERYSGDGRKARYDRAGGPRTAAYPQVPARSPRRR